MWSPFAESPPRSVAPASNEVQPPVGEVRGHLHADVGHQPARLRDEPLHLLERHRLRPGRPLRLSSGGGLGVRPGPAIAGGAIGDVGDLLPVVAGVGDEVLQDHLLDVAVALLHRGERLQRRDPLVLGLADPDEDPGGEGDPLLAGGLDELEPHRRMLGRRARVDRLHQPLAHRLEHQALRGGHRSQAAQVRAGDDADVRMGKEPALERPLAGPGDVGGEVVVAPFGEPGGHQGVHLRLLAGQHEELLDVPALRLVEPLDHVLGRMEVGLMGGERAVLAVAAARPRQREREVAGIGDAPHSR